MKVDLTHRYEFFPMITKSYINENLKKMNFCYLSARSQKEISFFAKLAVLELCGWIELSMDDVIKAHAKRNHRDEFNIKNIENYVKKNSGFSYEKHFRILLIQLLGIVNLERFEKSLNIGIDIKFQSELNNLHKIRNCLAHTYIKGTTSQLDAPSITLARFEVIWTGLKEYEKRLRIFK